MRRLLLFTALALLFLVGSVGAVRAGSSVVTPHFALLMTYPDGSPCPAPCVLGIRPGYTLRQQVPGLLRQHPFVRDNSTTLCLENYGECEFKLLGFNMSGLVLYGVDNKVIEIYLSSDTSKPDSHPLMMGDFIDALGMPDKIVPHYACCTALQYHRTLSWIGQFQPTYGFRFYFTEQGITVQDYASVIHGVYQLHPDAPVLGFRVFNPNPDANAIIRGSPIADLTSPWDRWYGFTTAGRYFALARPDTKVEPPSP